MQANRIIERFVARFGSTITVIRSLAGEYIDRKWVNGASGMFDIIASVQPITGKEIDMMPEAIRNKELVKIYTTSQLAPADEYNGLAADKIIYNNMAYVVEKVDQWKNSHYIAVASLVNE